MGVAAVFDLDGTLVTFRFDFREWRRVLLGEMEKRGFDTGGLDPATPTQTILDAAKGQSSRLGSKAYEDFRRDAYAILDGLELAGASTSKALPGVPETLTHLRSRGVRMGVLTNSGRIAATESLGRSGLLGWFEFVLTRNDTEVMKPRPEGVLKAVELLRLPKADVFYIGDSTFDIIAGRQAGVRVVSVATGNYAAEELREKGADFVIGSISELSRVLGV